MNSVLDQKISAASAAEGVYSTDVTNVATIQTNIAAATSPLAPAEAQLNTDAIAYNAALVDLSQAALAAVVPTS